MIVLKNVTKKFGERVLFDHLNLTIPDGSFVIIAGESGCGKTTLLNIIGGLEKPDEGTVSVDGTDIYRHSAQKDYFLNKAGFLFQNFALLENRTVKQNLNLILKKTRTLVSMEQALEAVGLKGKQEVRIYTLSGGEQQRVALARLLMKKCSLILADEPTGSLDERNGEIVMNILHRMNDEGRTVIVVTHNEKIISSHQEVIHL